jgi:hypothetical protein
MTTDRDELKRAADRFKRWVLNQETKEQIYPNSQYLSYNPLLRDMHRLADYALEVLAQQDGGEEALTEGLTEGWIKSIGFKETDDPLRPCRNMFYLNELAWRPHFYDDFRGKWQFGSMTIQENPKTRRDVLNLMAALGIERKEPTR